MENKDSNDPEKKAQENEIRRNIVDRLCEPPNRQNRRNVAEEERSDGP
jgi:hypothetical protein